LVRLTLHCGELPLWLSGFEHRIKVEHY